MIYFIDLVAFPSDFALKLILSTIFENYNLMLKNFTMKTANLFKMVMLFLAIGVASCTSESTDDGGGNGNGGSGSLAISVDKSRVYDNTLVNFTVTDAGGSNVTSQAIISVDGTPIAGSAALMTGLGVKDVTAVVGTENSNTLQVEVIEPSFSTKVLVEQYTGTWCPWCPRISNGIEVVQSGANGDRFISVAVHNGDSMAFPLESQMRSAFNVNGFPTGILNREGEWSAVSGNDMNVSQIAPLLNQTKTVGLAIDSSVSGSTVNATVKVGFDFDESGMELVAFLIQNNVSDTQSNNTVHYGGPGIIQGYDHDDVLVAGFTDIFGDVIPADQQVGGGEYSASLTATANGVNSSDWDIVAFVLDDTGAVVNVQRAAVGQNKDFD